MSNEAWNILTLGDIGRIVTGNTPSKKHPEYYGDYMPWVKPGDIRISATIGSTKEYLSKKGSNYARVIPEGSVMVTCIGDLGNVAVANQTLATNQQINSIVPNEKLILSKFLFYCATQLKPWLIENSTSTTISMVNKGNFTKAPINVPSLKIQKRVVGKLDALFANQSKIQTSLTRLPSLLADFREAVLRKAVTGALTEEWRRENKQSAEPLLNALKKEHELAGGHKKGNAAKPNIDVHDEAFTELPKSWCKAQMREICRPDSPITYGILKPGPEITGGVPYLKVASYPGNKLSWQKVRHTSEEISDNYSRAILEAGDVILSIRGTVGRSILVPEKLSGGNITQDSARIRPQEGVSNEFLRYVLLSPDCQDIMRRVSKGVAVKGINIGDIRYLFVPLPSSEEQVEIVRRVKELFALADRIEAKMETLKGQVADLPQAILGKAFRGEL